jgi:hypothetical protein
MIYIRELIDEHAMQALRMALESRLNFLAQLPINGTRERSAEALKHLIQELGLSLDSFSGLYAVLYHPELEFGSVEEFKTWLNKPGNYVDDEYVTIAGIVKPASDWLEEEK